MTKSRGTAAMLFSALALLSGAVRADAIDDATRLLGQGNVAAAERSADELLNKTPKDARARFLKGLVLTERRDTEAAIGVFRSLVEDFPELPEPYNNLAVLYAGQGRYDRAREALEAAVRARPDFPTAHENLGDVYLRMAAQAYAEATKLDRANAGVQTKLRLANELLAYRPPVPTPKPPR